MRGFTTTLVAMLAFLFIGGCESGFGRLQVLGSTVWSRGPNDVVVKNNINGVILTNLAVAGQPILRRAGAGENAGLTPVTLRTGEEISVNPGYWGDGGASVEFTADVRDATTNEYLGVVNDAIYISGYYSHYGFNRYAEPPPMLIVDDFSSVRNARRSGR